MAIRPPPRLKLKSGKAGEPKLGEQSAASPVSSVRNPRPVQPRVFARLQALFPPSVSSPHSLSGPPSLPSTVTPPPPPPPPKFIKARIITWNMHDSLPKGDLEELLGSVPLHTTRSLLDEADRMRLPDLSEEEGHPYHIIVVGGQECPTLSGIPLGLAANFKHKDAREKDKEKERHKEKDAEKDHEKEKPKEKDIIHHTKSILSKHLKHDHTAHSRTPDSPPSDVALDASSIHSYVPTSGWSAVLEDWFANGVGSLHGVKPVVTGTVSNSPAQMNAKAHLANTPLVNGDAQAARDTPNVQASPKSPADYQMPNTIDVDWKPYDPSMTGSESSPTSDLRARTGPYELLVKERLMGIYVAVFVHRDVRPLVRGFSTGVVPAGLIGGRLGNKGGVGVSVDMHGTTLLFVNAHLAAHEGKVPLRVANLAKIKAELPVDPFLSPDDPRTFAEDLTDRFDHTWIFGDLNFRLDISRLHADWLISRKEYAQAFAFDQLHKLMEDGEPAFAGFNEAAIDFPPTFKYDVLRTLKRDKYKPRYGHKISMSDFSGVEGDRESRPDEINHLAEEDDEAQGDAVSVRSSVWTSNHSRHRTDATTDLDDSDPSPINSPAAQSIGGLPLSPTSNLVAQAALKAKATWLALLNSSRDSSPTTSSPKGRRTSAVMLGVPGSSVELSRGVRLTPNASATSLASPALRRAASTKTSLAQRRQDDDPLSSDIDKGVYDSSSKRRVPSWCDRILWKTTVEPPDEPEPEQEVEREENPIRSRGRANRVSQLLLQAFRPRARRDSIQTGSPISPHSSSVSTNLLSFSRFDPSSDGTPLAASPGLYQSKSLEPLPTSSITRTPSRPSAGRLGRQRSASATVVNNGPASRRQSMPVSPRPPRPLPPPRRAESDQRPEDQPPASLATPATHGAPKRWFLNLISRDHAPSPSSSIPVPSPQPPQPPPPQYRKGDVVCLKYHTLDDRQMRRLEGRSDHRPVIGSYAIYV